jgi:hypothetical protein
LSVTDSRGTQLGNALDQSAPMALVKVSLHSFTNLVNTCFACIALFLYVIVLNGRGLFEP